MKKTFPKLVYVAVAVFLAGLIYHFGGSGRREPAALEEHTEAVKVSVVTVGPIAEEVEVTGEVEPTAEVKLASKVTGRLVKLAAAEGDYVRKGQVVSELDRDLFEAAVRQAQAARAVAQANVKMAEVTAENAARDLERAQELFKEGVDTESNRDDAESIYKRAVTAVEMAKALIQASEAELETAEINLRESVISAPFDAVVAEKLLDVGSFVPAGTPILHLVSVDTVKVTAGVAERYLADLVPGKTATSVIVDAMSRREFPGTLHRISPVIDVSTRTAEVDIRIANADHALKPGMYARVKLTTRQKEGAVLVPNDAVLGREGLQYALVVAEERVMRRAIKLGIRGRLHCEVLEGLSGGETVVVSGAGNLVDGARVRVDEEVGK